MKKEPQVVKLQVGDGEVTVITTKLGNMPLFIARARKGYVACSYIDVGTAEKVGDMAAFVSGVTSLDDFLKAKVRKVTTWAKSLGIKEGMGVKKALDILNRKEE